MDKLYFLKQKGYYNIYTAENDLLCWIDTNMPGALTYADLFTNASGFVEELERTQAQLASARRALQTGDVRAVELLNRTEAAEAQLAEANENMRRVLEQIEAWNIQSFNQLKRQRDVALECKEKAEADVARLLIVVNRVAAQVGHPPIAHGEAGIESVAEAVERRLAHAREHEETLDSITPEAHHDEHHEREKRLEAEVAQLRDDIEELAFCEECGESDTKLEINGCYPPRYCHTCQQKLVEQVVRLRKPAEAQEESEVEK